MICPLCDSNTRVIDSHKIIDHVVRVRKCEKCDYRFYTEEVEIKDEIAKREIYDNHNEYRRKRLKKNKEVTK